MDSTSAFSKYRNRFGYIAQGTIGMVCCMHSLELVRQNTRIDLILRLHTLNLCVKIQE